MTSHALLLRLFPLLLFAGIAILSLLLNFNGLYGQDAHEYLRQSRAIFNGWATGAPIPSTLGDAEFAKGYPTAGALLRYIFGNPILAMQVVSWLAYATAAWLLERILFLLAHGSRADSRLVFVVLTLALAPVFVRSGLTVMSDAPGLALILAAFFFSLRWIENERPADTVWAAVMMALAISVRVGLAGLMIPLALSVGWFLFERRKWPWIPAALLAGLAVMAPQFWFESGVISHPLQHSMFQHWSPANFFHRTFNNENGLSQYLLPNVLYLAFPLMHPGFCLAIPGLFLLAKKTDIHLPAKRTILFCLTAYLVLLGGLPHQNLRFLLPAYVLVLLMAFSAWDRMYCYGFYFFKRLTWSILGATLALQLCCCVWMLYPTVVRNRLESSVAAEIRPLLPPGTVVYSFDLDIALKSYLPGVSFENMWSQRYEHYPPGSFVLFNEPALRRQWEGQNPMLNWDYLTENYLLEVAKELPEGWVLYVVKELK